MCMFIDGFICLQATYYDAKQPVYCKFDIITIDGSHEMKNLLHVKMCLIEDFIAALMMIFFLL